MSDVQIDLSRRERMGFPEIVYGEFKNPDQLRRILAVFREAGQGALVTRLQPEKAVFLEGGSYDAAARTYLAGPGLPARPGLVGIVTGGTSDAPVAAEAAAVLDFLGISRRVWNDLGVSCLDRVLSRLPELRECDVLIAGLGPGRAVSGTGDCRPHLGGLRGGRRGPGGPGGHAGQLRQRAAGGQYRQRLRGRPGSGPHSREEGVSCRFSSLSLFPG